MTAMRAAVLHAPGDLRVEERPIPAPGPGEALVRVAVCGVCGTRRDRVRPRPAAHGAAGRRSGTSSPASSRRLGEGVDAPRRRCTRGVRRGHLVRRVQAVPWRAARTCAAPTARRDCRSTADWPAMSSCRRTPARCLGLPGCRSDTLGLAQPMSIAVHAVRRSGLRAGEDAVIVGIGGIGVVHHVRRGRRRRARHRRRPQATERLGTRAGARRRRDALLADEGAAGRPPRASWASMPTCSSR